MTPWRRMRWLVIAWIVLGWLLMILTATGVLKLPERKEMRVGKVQQTMAVEEPLPVRRRSTPPLSARTKPNAKTASSSKAWHTMIASWYEYGSVTASGERFRPDGLTAAHRELPFGTLLEVCGPSDCVVVRINDRGPFVRGRDLDLSRGAARRIGILEDGVAQVRVRMVNR